MTSVVEDLAQHLGVQWPTIATARVDATSKLREYSDALADIGSADAAIVFYGSLARGEWTRGSDVDWTLLVDGPAQRTQLISVRQVREKLKDKPPTPGGAFGSMSSSHELLHRIGGDADTNRITTQRVLLLLESVAIADASGQQRLVHQRVVRNILDSYLDEGDGTSSEGVPRFLLNDVVRYWRTIAVDFAAKSREQGDKKWAIRRLKLRTSRKLIFSAGLVMALDACVGEKRLDREELLEALVLAVQKTPLEIIAGVALRHPAMESAARSVLDQYELFLRLLDDTEKRERLETMLRSEAYTDPSFAEAREIGRAFGSAIEAFFFDGVYAKAIRTYGVF